MEENIEVGQLYKVELSRTVKKPIGKKTRTVVAGSGKIFLVVICRGGKSKSGKAPKYWKSFEILLGTPQENIDEMAEQLYQQLKKQFSL